MEHRVLFWAVNTPLMTLEANCCYSCAPPFILLCFISPLYSRDSWLSTWSAAVHPIVDPQSWLVPQHVRDQICKLLSCLKRPAGRPKKTRIPSVGEFRGSGSERQKCSRCHIFSGIIKNHVAI
ncbi:unnamed protein product, partial [Cuscuta epithymum]